MFGWIVDDMLKGQGMFKYYSDGDTALANFEQDGTMIQDRFATYVFSNGTAINWSYFYTF